MLRLAMILLIAAVPCLAAEVIAPPQELAPTRELILQSVHDRAVPGCAVAVIKNGALVWLEGFGDADMGTHAAPTPDTPFPLTSCSKPMTAFAFLRMRERGLIDLDKPVNAYLGEGVLRAAVGKAEDITSRRLLNHTAGFARCFSYYYPPATPGALDSFLAHYGQAVIAPGSAFEYSNLGYAAAGAVLQKEADLSLAQVMRDNVFAPLGMAHSAAEAPAGAATLYVRDAADRYHSIPATTSDHTAGSGYWASAADAARFLMLLLNEGTLDGTALLKPESVRELFAAPKGFAQAGLGWFLGDFLAQKSFSHAGGLPGAMAELRGFPADKSGVVVLTNTDGHSLTGQIIWSVANALYPNAKEKEEAPAEAPSTEAQAFAGEWHAELAHYSGKVALTLLIDDEDTAYLRFEEGPMRRLQNFSLVGEEVSGFLWTDFPARDDVHSPVKVRVTLKKLGDSLAGTFSTELDRQFELPTYVRFEAAAAAPKKEEKKQ